MVALLPIAVEPAPTVTLALLPTANELFVDAFA